MLNKFRDRFRIPWRGGAKELSFEAVLPLLLLPPIFMAAAINQITAVIITVFSTIAMLLLQYHVQKKSLRSRFFCMWIFWSLVFMIILFESTVPLWEVLPEENLLLVVLSSLALYCLWRTRQRAHLNLVPQRTTQHALSAEELSDIVEVDEDVDALGTANYVSSDDAESQTQQQQRNICATCRKYVPSRTAHCSPCGACILRHDHHSYWLDCCIGKENHGSYLLGMLLAMLALLLAANFILTAVCHPLLVQRVFGVPLMVPDDCSQVFDEYEYALSFSTYLIH